VTAFLDLLDGLSLIQQVILLLLSATFPNSKLAAKNTEQDKKRKLAEENPGTSASFKTRILVHQIVVI
jgi:hypothetical protein